MRAMVFCLLALAMFAMTCSDHESMQQQITEVHSSLGRELTPDVSDEQLATLVSDDRASAHIDSAAPRSRVFAFPRRAGAFCPYSPARPASRPHLGKEVSESPLRTTRRRAAVRRERTRPRSRTDRPGHNQRRIVVSRPRSSVREAAPIAHQIHQVARHVPCVRAIDAIRINRERFASGDRREIERSLKACCAGLRRAKCKDQRICVVGVIGRRNIEQICARASADPNRVVGARAGVSTARAPPGNRRRGAAKPTSGAFAVFAEPTAASAAPVRAEDGVRDVGAAAIGAEPAVGPVPRAPITTSGAGQDVVRHAATSAPASRVRSTQVDWPLPTVFSSRTLPSGAFGRGRFALKAWLTGGCVTLGALAAVGAFTATRRVPVAQHPFVTSRPSQPAREVPVVSPLRAATPTRIEPEKKLEREPSPRAARSVRVHGGARLQSASTEETAAARHEGTPPALNDPPVAAQVSAPQRATTIAVDNAEPLTATGRTVSNHDDTPKVAPPALTELAFMRRSILAPRVRTACRLLPGAQAPR